MTSAPRGSRPWGRSEVLSAGLRAWEKVRHLLQALDELTTKAAKMKKQEGCEAAVYQVQRSLEFCETKEERINFLEQAGPATENKILEFVEETPVAKACKQFFRAAHTEIMQQLAQYNKPKAALPVSVQLPCDGKFVIEVDKSSEKAKLEVIEDGKGSEPGEQFEMVAGKWAA